MPLVEALTAAAAVVMPMFGLELGFLAAETHPILSSGDEVNVLLGLTGGMRGSVVLGCTMSAALSVVSGMMGGLTVCELDEMGKSALAEMGNMLVGTALGYLQTTEAINLSPPTLIVGRRLLLQISQEPSTCLFYSLGESRIRLAYSVA